MAVSSLDHGFGHLFLLYHYLPRGLVCLLFLLCHLCRQQPSGAAALSPLASLPAALPLTVPSLLLLLSRPMQGQPLALQLSHPGLSAMGLVAAGDIMGECRQNYARVVMMRRQI